MKSNEKKTVKTTEKKTTKKMDSMQLDRIKTRKSYYMDNDFLMMNSSVTKAKNSNMPFMTKKNEWLYKYLLQNDINKNWNYTLDSISNLYRKEVKDTKEKTAKTSNYKFRKGFKTSEVFSINDLKSVIQYIYLVNKRMFVYYCNDKGNYNIKEIGYCENLTVLKDRK